ncbi:MULTISPECIES: Fpg/Nei family DNA glycosylase [Streptomyces]|uniref:Fpg/Nei family DNA glycosylase n=1 Tax=Streptomyces tsukubensis (strain DSM 42081 / NBRC 108919 / NRRL 18488 / 9993) TaxID=1114943 RepID=I2NAL8_STRT9|nr:MULTISPECIES: DNA-formamidopyrimidine glycosylase family protein [Streptomyces]AZK97845.1 endonuclease VIII [Streptomyces tsukubensis]EIF94065.1 DNA-formamidopyrimidine glycosylase [Streptomyces tsukubensis NRRL18488]MYS68583.1 Fpg/Nei family DNA glycosylase [Streptomyces sp. SID5473]QKM66227.1 Fpg/Nei family DNA glycosylase [Streptomyces tsukubensis NRRL18488]TAI45435.1 Fpg/Nei family DNA glycosylase [Streptomyces tsukubensis]
MPELPEVESLRGFLDEKLTGLRIARVLPLSISVLKTYDPPLSAVEGAEVTAVGRYGKWLDIRAGGLHLVFHLARAGWLRWYDELPATPPRPGKGPLALRTVLASGAGFDLTEAGTTKRLAVHLVRDPAEVSAIARLGPDPLAEGFDRAAFAAVIAGEKRQLKGALRDQSLIAGIGNAYSDEILHAARMSPFKQVRQLDEAETTRLYEALRTTLGEAVDRARGVAAAGLKAEKKSGLRVHGRTGEPCPVCGDTIREVSFSDSSLQYCPTCQTGGKPLADRRMSRLLK